MKTLFTVSFLLTTAILFAQPTIVKQAIVNTTTNIIAPEEEDVQNIQGQGSGAGMNFRNMMDGEMKFTTYLKNDLVKTIIKTEMGRSTIIRNNEKKLTTTLIEMMGNKMGFYATDEEMADMQKKRDSMMQARRKKDSSAPQAPAVTTEKTIDISYTEDTKKIAGYVCKKAYVITTGLLGLKDTAVVWYTPEFKLLNVLSTGGMSGFGNMGTNLGGLDKIDGFVMRYEMNMRRNRRMEVEVTKVDFKKEIEDKEFEVPKDFDLKPMKDMQGMFGGQGGFQMRRPQQ